MNGLKKVFKGLDYYIVIPVVFLCLMGLMMVYSAGIGVEFFNDKGITADGLFRKQRTSMIIGAIGCFLAFRLSYRFYDLKWVKWGIVGLNFFLLLLVLAIGKEVNGSKSWLDIGVQFQPAELSKLTIIVALALYYSKRQRKVENSFWRYTMMPVYFVVCPTLFLVFMQRDIGTLMIIGAIVFTIVLCSGYKFKRILMMTLPIILIAYGGVWVIGQQVVGKESSFRVARLANMVAPFEDFKATGWQMSNSYLAIASGGIEGKGLGESIQKFGYLPEPQTDFIFSIIAEELGFFGVFILLLSLAIVIGRILYIGMQCHDAFGTLICVGIASMMMIHIGLNIGAIVGLVPLTGVPLPFLSYGGTSVIVMLIGVGMALNVSRYVHSDKNRPAEAI